MVVKHPLKNNTASNSSERPQSPRAESCASRPRPFEHIPAVTAGQLQNARASAQTRTIYAFAVSPVESRRTSSRAVTVTSESLYLNHSSGLAGKLRA